MSEDTSCIPGKDVNLFQRGQIIDTHQAKKTSKETDKTTKTGFRTELKTGRIAGNHQERKKNL